MTLPAATHTDLQTRYTNAKADLAAAQANGNQTIQAMANDELKQFQQVANVNGDAALT